MNYEKIEKGISLAKLAIYLIESLHSMDDAIRQANNLPPRKIHSWEAAIKEARETR